MRYLTAPYFFFTVLMRSCRRIPIHYRTILLIQLLSKFHPSANPCVSTHLIVIDNLSHWAYVNQAVFR